MTDKQVRNGWTPGWVIGSVVVVLLLIAATTVVVLWVTGYWDPPPTGPAQVTSVPGGNLITVEGNLGSNHLGCLIFDANGNSGVGMWCMPTPK